jgi:DNA-binding MarR family transcriptional regulator
MSDEINKELDALERKGLVSRRTSYSAIDLLATDFPEPRFAVPNILAEGLNFMAGAPKLGKSWWALGIAIAVASGGRALGQIPVERGDVLYLGLEDSPRRLKSRLEKMLVGGSAPDGLHFYTEWDRLTDGGAEEIERWVEEHPACRLVIVDVFARVRPRLSDRSDRYLADYEAAQPLKTVADQRGLAILALHHTRKAAAEDFVETVSGTHGLAAAADTIIVCKRARGQADATLHITGRDVEEQDLALRFDAAIGTWKLLGEAREWAVSEQRRKIIETLEVAGAMKPKQLAEAAGLDHGVVKHLVRSMVEAGQIDSDGSGSYLIHRSPHSPVHPIDPVIHPSSEQSEQSEGFVGGDLTVGAAAEYTLSETRLRILQVLKDLSEGMRPKEIAEEVDIAYETVKKAVQRMARDGQLDVRDGIYSVPPVSLSPVPLSLEGGDGGQGDTRDASHMVPEEVLSMFPGSEEAFDYEEVEPDFQEQAREVEEWNDYIIERARNE